MVRGPGTIIKQTLSKWFGIQTRDGCGCRELAREMDTDGYERVRIRIEDYTERMFLSVQKWRRLAEGKTIVPQPPKCTIKQFILWSCTKSEQEHKGAA